MDKELIKNSVLESIDLIDSFLIEKEKMYVLNKILDEYSKIKKYTDTFIIVSIISKTFADCFIKYNKEHYKLNNSYDKVIPIAFILGLNLIKEPISYKIVNEDNIIKKINEEADFSKYLDSVTYKNYLERYRQCIIHNSIHIMSKNYKEVYDYTIKQQYNDLRNQCEDNDDFEMKYGHNSQYYRSKNKIKILGGFRNGKI